MSGSVTAMYTQQVAGCAAPMSPGAAVKGRKNNFAQKGKLSFLRLSSSFSSKNFPDTGDTGIRVLHVSTVCMYQLYCKGTPPVECDTRTRTPHPPPPT